MSGEESVARQRRGKSEAQLHTCASCRCFGERRRKELEVL